MTDSQKWLLLTGLLVAGVLIYLLSPILTPFLLAALLAYVGDPIADRLQARGLPRTAATVVVLLALGLVLVLLPLVMLPLLQGQVQALARLVPAALDWLVQTALPWVEANLGISTALPDAERVRSALGEHWQAAGSVVADVVGYATRSGLALAGFLAGLVLVPVVTFYTLRDWDRMVAGLRDLLPRNLEPTVTALVAESDRVLASFLRGQLAVMISLGVVYSAGLWLAGIELALAIGLLAGLVSFVPYLGVIVGMAVAILAVLVQSQDPTQLVWVVVVFGIGQMLEGMVLTPLLVGDRVGLHPVAVIFAVLAGGQLFGFFGILLALPVASVLAVLVRHLRGRYRASELYAGTAPGEP
ncbi:MAG: AI-2E family transporter [Gammaproteobacteria bacterium]|nr:AI-2E family transporter [Gammaproteobacteria bacterium]